MSTLHLTEVDDLTRDDHYYLEPDDQCYFLREYTSGAGYEFSETNSLISNLKKKMDTRGTPQWKWKTRAIRQAAKELRGAINPAYLRSATLVPIPPSKVRSDPLYDDRMVQVLRHIAGTDGDVRELLVQMASTTPAHQTQERRDPLRIEENYEIVEALSEPPPTAIAIFDDVLTTGAHFRAAKAKLSGAFPAAPILGVFVARRVFPEGLGALDDEWDRF